MKQLVFVIESLNLGGAEKCLVSLLQNIDYSKNNVDLVLFKSEGLFEKFLPNEVNVIRKKFPALTFSDRIRFKIMRVLYQKKFHSAQLLWMIMGKKCTNHSKKYDYGIAYNQGFATYYTSRYISANKKFSWLNINYQKAGYNLDFDFPFYQKFHKIVAVSPEVKAVLDNVLQEANRYLSVDVVLDIIDRKLIEQQSLEKLNYKFDLQSINLVSVGRLAKQKGLHLAIESCKKLIDKGYDFKWYVLGEGSERSTLEKMICNSNLQNHFILLGATDNPFPYVNACDIFVQTSLFEGLGTAVIEASFLNKPIVCTNFPSVYGILEPEVTGLIAEMNANSISDKIEMLINDSKLKNRLIENLMMKDANWKELPLKQFNELISN